MQVIYDAQAFQMERHGGISRYFQQLIQALLLEEQAQLSLISGLHISEIVATLPPGLRRRGLSCRMPGVERTFRLRNTLNALHSRLLLSSCKSFIYHPTYYQTWAPPRHRRTVVTVHDMLHEKFPTWMSPKDKTALWKAASVQRATVIVTVSANTRKDLLERYNLPEDRVFVTPLACALPSRGQVVMIRPKPYLLFVGARRSYKNFGVILRLLETFPQLRRDFDVVCFGGGAFEQPVLPEIIHLQGDDHLLADLYRNAFALIYPSRYEGFGLPLLEAMHCGCPVITTRGGSLPEVGGDVVEYFDPDSCVELRSCVERVGHSDRRNDMVAKGTAREASFSWRDCAQRTLAAYQLADRLGGAGMEAGLVHARCRS